MRYQLRLTSKADKAFLFQAKLTITNIERIGNESCTCWQPE